MSKYYSIYDREGKVFRDPFPAPSDADACRMVTASMLTPQGAVIKNSPMFMYAAQFDLMCVGVWNSEIGAIISFDKHDSHDFSDRPMPVANVIALVPTKEEK